MDLFRLTSQQALEALLAQPIQTTTVWKDGIDIDEPVYHSSKAQSAIEALKELVALPPPDWEAAREAYDATYFKCRAEMSLDEWKLLWIAGKTPSQLYKNRLLQEKEKFLNYLLDEVLTERQKKDFANFQHMVWSGGDSPAVSPEKVVTEGPPTVLNSLIDEYVEDYELEGDDGHYAPTEPEKLLIKDAVHGLLAEPDFVKAVSTMGGDLSTVGSPTSSDPVQLKKGECWPESVMKEWDFWRERIATDNKSLGSEPRDWFESLAEMRLVPLTPPIVEDSPPTPNSAD